MLCQPAIVLDLSSTSVESATVCYVNPTFADLFDADQGTSNDAPVVGQLFIDILQLRLTSPRTTVFLQWMAEVLAVKVSTQLRSQFKGSAKAINIKWTGVLVENKYFVLTGRISSPSNLPSPERTSRAGTSDLKNEDITSQRSSTDSSSPPLHRTVSRQLSPIDSRLKADPTHEPQATWRNTEKVIFLLNSC